METHHRVIFGDSRFMASIKDETVQLIATSPPYWQLKDYGKEEQIGFHQSYPEYIADLNRVWSECYRVLSPGCRLCVNIGDQFARAVHYGRYKVIPIREEIVRFCESIGFDYMGAIIWQKATTMNTSGGGAVMGSFPYPRNGILKIDYEFILLFKKLGKPPKVTPDQKTQSAMTTAEWNQYFSGHWNFAGEKQGNGHIAMFPVELPRRLIKMFSFAGETVLDPFAGSGTTLKAARELGRCSVGYEINSEFLPAIKKRLGLETPSLLDENNVSFEYEASTQAVEYTPEVSTHSILERKVDPKAFRFGSVLEVADLEVSNMQKTKERGLRVRQIIAPDRLVLQEGGEVKLLGVTPIQGRENAALAYLRNFVLNKPVVLKFDEEMHDSEGVLQAYVYLENKTFVNAKLIKNGLAQPDTKTHRYASRFKDYQPKEIHV